MQRQSSENQPITKRDVLNPLSRAWVKHIALFHPIDYQHVGKPFCAQPRSHPSKFVIEHCAHLVQGGDFCQQGELILNRSCFELLGFLL